jgi:hypothetical protein
VSGYELADLFCGLSARLYGGLNGTDVAQDSNGNQAALYLFDTREFDGGCLHGCVRRFNDARESASFD